jgi:hypothetical protein
VGVDDEEAVVVLLIHGGCPSVLCDGCHNLLVSLRTWPTPAEGRGVSI